MRGPTGLRYREPDAGRLGIGVASREDAMTVRTLVAAGLYLLPADRSTFRCGDEALDRFFHRYAGETEPVPALHRGNVRGVDGDRAFATVAPWHIAIERTVAA